MDPIFFPHKKFLLKKINIKLLNKENKLKYKLENSGEIYYQVVA